MLAEMNDEITVEHAPKLPQPSPALIALIVVLVGAAFWASLPGLTEMFQLWSDDPRYSHGFLVPIFSLYLLYHRREMLLKLGPPRGVWTVGVPLLVFGAILKLIGGKYFIAWFDGISLLPTLAGITVVLGGLSALRWAWPAIAFLFFMIQLPYRVENAIGPPLQSLATKVSTYVLQTFGLPAQAEEHIINLEDIQIGVVEACNGLGMLMMFFAYATAVVMVIKRPLLDKIVLMLSAAPIAMIANIMRISLTGLLHAYSTKAIADHVYHDLAGWLMMPMALLMFGTELYILSQLFLEVTPEPVRSYDPKDGKSGGKGSKAAGSSPLLIDVRSIPRDPKRDKPRR
jgi:exosortase